MVEVIPWGMAYLGFGPYGTYQTRDIAARIVRRISKGGSGYEQWRIVDLKERERAKAASWAMV